ncbi:acyl-CoA synthetase [Mycolicibacterium palauense]|uniref:acyl-CoA synthetase n=1 Tax=Mycolicibacterium palauense TaxID=2034511 RepID=UPI00114523C5|nr:AMP-binding protein [Mycolicibacterium palauense]
MSRPHAELRDELLAERNLPPREFWDATEERLDWPLDRGLNLAHECCDRWAVDRSRVAMSVHDPDGTVSRWTYYELMTASRALANAFTAAGLRRGDRVAAVLDQQIEAYICALAAWRAGLVYVPLFVGFGVDALAERINGAEPTVVVVDHRYRAAYAKVHSALTSAPAVWTVAGPRGTGISTGDASLWSEIATQNDDFATVRTKPSDCATLIYTSGTTGKPKGVLHPHSLIIPLQGFLRHVMAPGSDDWVFAGANPGWSFGLYAAGLGVQSLGVGRVMYTGSFDPAAWLRVMHEERVTYVASAPSAYRGLITAAARAGLPDTVRGGLSAGEPLTTSLVTAWNEIGGGRLQDAYGSSEMSMVLANLAFDDRDIPAGALSSVLPGYDVALVDEHGQPQESEGIIGIRDPRWPVLGYHGLDELWDSKTVNGVFQSGDMARRDEHGHYWFAGRHDDVIVTAGYNVGPTEVEEVVASVPGVKEVAVVAAPDEARGSVVRAVVVDDGSVPRTVLTGAIQRAARERLGRHAYPKIIDFVAELPRTETGKIRRNLLRQDA